jgi:hypothetical protein
MKKWRVDGDRDFRWRRRGIYFFYPLHSEAQRRSDLSSSTFFDLHRVHIYSFSIWDPMAEMSAIGQMKYQYGATVRKP